jgi:hypothetical protein
MKTYFFHVDVLWNMHTTCEVEAENEEAARALVMADDNAVLWEGSMDWGDQEKIVAMELIEEKDA